MRLARVTQKQVLPIIISILVQFHLPQVSLAQAMDNGLEPDDPLPISASLGEHRVIPYREGREPLADHEKPGARLLGLSKKQTPAPRNMRMVITAYSSTPDQTDNTPCITANGYNVCTANAENVIAANFLPFGARVQIPELFGDRVFTVQDRMNARHSQRVDIWMTSRHKAKQFGVKRAEIVVLPKEVAPRTTQVVALK
ncbi:MAG: hypothetical protein AAB855_04435 [Patescibacteria group bacterium]